MRCWVPTKIYFQALYQVNLAVHKALAEKDFTIPFSQRDVHLTRQD